MNRQILGTGKCTHPHSSNEWILIECPSRCINKNSICEFYSVIIDEKTLVGEEITDYIANTNVEKNDSQVSDKEP